MKRIICIYTACKGYLQHTSSATILETSRAPHQLNLKPEVLHSRLRQFSLLAAPRSKEAGKRTAHGDAPLPSVSLVSHARPVRSPPTLAALISSHRLGAVIPIIVSLGSCNSLSFTCAAFLHLLLQCSLASFTSRVVCFSPIMVLPAAFQVTLLSVASTRHSVVVHSLCFLLLAMPPLYPCTPPPSSLSLTFPFRP